MTAIKNTISGCVSSVNDDRHLIAHVIHRLQTGGMENGLVNLINHLPTDRFRHAVICLTESTDFEQRMNANNVTVHALHKREGKDPLHYVRFWQLLHKLRPTILHTRNLGTLDFAPLAALSGVPVRIHGEHGWDASDPSGQSKKYRLLRRICNYAVTDYVAVSKDITRWLTDIIGIPQSRILQIYNGVDLDVFRPDGLHVDLPFKEARDGLLVIGTVGRMDPIKNFDWLITAVAQMLNANPELQRTVRLIMVGDGPLRHEIRARLVDTGLMDKVWLTGERADVADLLRSIDVFVLPSINEGISNTILESMATGLSIIATDVGGNRELICDGESGFLVAANDTDAFVNAIYRYTRNPELRRVHGVAACERARQFFSLQTMVRNYMNLYDELLNDRRLNGIH